MKRFFGILSLMLVIGYGTALWADSYTLNYRLTKPSRGSANWDTKINTNMDTIDELLLEALDGNIYTTAIRPESFGAIGDGITDDTAAVEAAITACPATGCTLRLTQTYRIVDDVSIPTKTRVDFTPAGKLSIDSTYTVTFVSPSYITAANNQQIFDGGGTVEFTLPGIVYANWWGAKEDATDAAGTTDAIQAAITAAAPVPTAFDYDDRRQHAGTVRLACGHYLIDQPLKMPNNVVGLTLESECGAMHGFGQTAIQWAGTNMTDADDWMIDAGSVMGFRLKGIHLIGNADDDNATSPCIQNGVFVRRVNSGFFASGNMWEDVTIRRFPGIGVQWGDYTDVDLGAGNATDHTNTDNSYIKNLMIQDCRIGMVIDSPNFMQVLFDRILIMNYGGNPVDDDNVTPIEDEDAAPIKFRTKNAVQILHGYFHAVEASLYASYADDDNHSQYAIYALDGSFNILSGYSEARFLAYVAEGDETQGQQQVNMISNFNFFPGLAGGPATPGKYPIYYRKSYMPLLLNGTRNIWVMEDPISAGVISVGCKVETKFLSRYMLGGNWWEQFTRNPNSYDWGLMTLTNMGEGVQRWNVSTQIGAAGTAFDSPDGKTFRLLNNLVRSTYVDENGTETTTYYVSPGEESPGVTTTVSLWDFGADGIRARHLLGAMPQALLSEAEIAANDFGECRYSSSSGELMLLSNGWTEHNATRKVGYRFGLDRRQIQFWGELNGDNATAAEILNISGIVKCEDIRMADGESFYVAANGNGELLPLKFTCVEVGETGDYMIMSHGDWPEDENSTRIDRVSLDGITIFVK